MSIIKIDETSSARKGKGAVSSAGRCDEELDLLDVLSIIFSRKYTLALFTALALFIGLGVSYLLPQRWTSSAMLSVAEAAQLHSMEKMLTELQVLDIDTKITPASLLTDFIRNFDSPRLREQYLVGTAYFKQLAKGLEQSPEERNRLINSILSGNIESQSSSDSKKEYRFYEVKYSANSAPAARELLQGYINYVTSVVEKELQQRITYHVDMVKGKAIGQYNLDKKRVENEHSIKLERLEYALQVANSAGLKKPVWSINGTSTYDDWDYLESLGSEGLKRKLKIEQSVEDPTLLNVDLQNRRVYIEKLQALKISELHIEPFKYMRVPYEPLYRDSPKRSLIALMSAVVGLITGCGYVLLSNAIKAYRQSLKKKADTPD
ncbi:LPS O-antigen length regulator Wzz(fepE) [Erwinia sorbitola]|uniref:LPS O-antigen length regulator n=1 Tax=Erwinia sorbitola TaxID=2681984 RepID=A0A6I6ECE7_9GAMM|nr:LPS O-antigen length regulator Wzz(fepE) [Erwinia sorbitola]QGU86308.1 LPS O-antigen length regulator [Erwinia sorbitola]